jgi:anti-sigma factor RsiW
MDARITEIDLQAYIDGQLDMLRRVEVEDYLAGHPQDAALVMEDMKLRDELRLFLAEAVGPPPAATVRMSRRLSAALHRRELVPRLRRASLAAALIAAGWFAHAIIWDGMVVNPPPGITPADLLAEDAAQAWHVAQLDSPPELTEIAGPAEISGTGTATGPLLEYRRIGSNLVPWKGGTAVLDLFVTPRGEELVLLTARTGATGDEALEARLADGVTTVSWSRDDLAYALSGALPTAVLLALARSVDPLT